MAFGCKKNNKDSNEHATVLVKKVADGYKLFRNGKPFYIKGGAGDGSLDMLKEIGGNTIRVYDTINLDTILKKADSLGIAVIVDIPLPGYSSSPDFYENDRLFSEMKNKILSLVSNYKNHTSLLYWNLGNEIMYSIFSKKNDFYKRYNILIDIIKTEDPNHPVSTSIKSFGSIPSLAIESPQLDFVSINTFGNLKEIKRNLNTISLIWNGPYIISEWGINGPWEEETTNWGAPIEKTSTKKAEFVRKRYHSDIITDPSCMGTLYFYWGKKQERTATWFSTFTEEGEKNEIVFDLENLWNNTNKMFTGPKLDYALLNGKGAPQSIVLLDQQSAKAEIKFNSLGDSVKSFNWEIKKEAWFNIYKEEPNIPFTIINQTYQSIQFITPQDDGPYRLFYTIVDKNGFFATTNIPFYILGTGNGK